MPDSTIPQVGASWHKELHLINPLLHYQEYIGEYPTTLMYHPSMEVSDLFANDHYFLSMYTKELQVQHVSMLDLAHIALYYIRKVLFDLQIKCV